ncbi:MAG: C-GCAxxG-C-C family protein [Chloroflexota bacterium]
MQHYYDFITDDMLVSAIALAGGGGRSTTGSCGAYSGGLMALSTRFCPGGEELTEEELARLDKAKPNFYEFRDWFIKEFSGVNCVQILRKLFGGTFDLNNDKSVAELRKIQKELGFNCELVTGKVAVKLAEMLGT